MATYIFEIQSYTRVQVEATTREEAEMLTLPYQDRTFAAVEEHGVTIWTGTYDGAELVDPEDGED